jgi:hypothetical protein
MRIVNGYSCATCADEAIAKRGVDPRESPTSIQAAQRGAPDPTTADYQRAIEQASASKQTAAHRPGLIDFYA